MNKRSLADLAKILEEAANPESEHREDRKETKVKVQGPRKVAQVTRLADPKRKAWYDKRLREQTVPKGENPKLPAPEAAPTIAPAVTKAAATQVGGSLLQALAATKNPKVKTEDRKVEPWRRKPGDPLF